MRILLTMAALLLAAGASLGALAYWQAQTGSDVRTIDVRAERFTFTPSEIRTTVGTPLVIRLQSDDTDHGFRILGTDVDLVIPKRGRGVATVTFTPERAGEYTFECSQICGAGHDFMRGVIVVEAPQPE